MAQFERQLIQERTRVGLDAARARGRKGGRKKVEATNPRVQIAKNMHKNHGMSIDDICKILKISRASFYRYKFMTIKVYLVAFIDILGFKNYINNDFEKGKKLLIELSKFDNTREKGLPQGSPKVTAFSDSIIISYLCYKPSERKEPTIGRVTKLLQQHICFLADKLLAKGLLIRGGISHGTDFFHENGVICGIPFLNAYALEQKAIYPRIMIDENTIKYLDNALIKTDLVDGKQILNYISVLASNEQDMIRFGIDRPSDLFLNNILDKIKQYESIVNKNISKFTIQKKCGKEIDKWKWFLKELNLAKCYWENQ